MAPFVHRSRMSLPKSSTPPEAKNRGTIEPSEATATAVRSLCRDRGATATAVDLGVNSSTLMRIAARLPVRRPTLAFVEERLGRGQPAGAS